MAETPPPPSVVEAKAAYERASRWNYASPGCVWLVEDSVAAAYISTLEQTLATERADREKVAGMLETYAQLADLDEMGLNIDGASLRSLRDELASSPEGATCTCSWGEAVEDPTDEDCPEHGDPADTPPVRGEGE